jgi:hypothetical protein
MIPSTFLSGVAFLFLIAPGVLWDLLAKRRKVSSIESTFRETSRVVLSSSALSLLSVAIMTVIGLFRPNWFLSPRSFLSNPEQYYRLHPLIVWRVIILEALIAVLLVLIPNASLLRKQGWRLREVSPWQKVFRIDLPEKHYASIRVRLLSGKIYVGRVSDYTPDFEMADREIVLCQPLWSEREDKSQAKFPDDWQRLIIPATSIETISVQYLKIPDDDLN